MISPLVERALADPSKNFFVAAGPEYRYLAKTVPAKLFGEQSKSSDGQNSPSDRLSSDPGDSDSQPCSTTVTEAAFLPESLEESRLIHRPDLSDGSDPNRDPQLDLRNFPDNKDVYGTIYQTPHLEGYYHTERFAWYQDPAVCPAQSHNFEELEKLAFYGSSATATIVPTTCGMPDSPELPRVAMSPICPEFNAGNPDFQVKRLTLEHQKK